jgi:hypothetical protein
MTDWLHLAFLTVMLLAVALAAALLQPEWARDLGVEKYSACLRNQPLFADRHQSAEMRQRQEGLTRRLHDKGRIVKDLTDGRITLAEAVALFRRSNELNSLGAAPGSVVSEDELLYRQVISWGRGELSAKSPDAAAYRAAQWEEEMRRQLGRPAAGSMQ